MLAHNNAHQTGGQFHHLETWLPHGLVGLEDYENERPQEIEKCCFLKESSEKDMVSFP